MSTTRSVLFGERAAGVYLLTEIYDPDVDGTSPQASGKIVPAVGSLVIDNTKGLHNQQYTVTAVDQRTYKSTMIPSTFVIDSTAQIDRVLSYGNDLFMLYVSQAQITIAGSNINLHRLIVDNKLCLFGNHAATYQLVKYDNETGQEVVISRKYMQGDKQLDVISGVVDGSTISARGTAISMLNTGVYGIRKCDGCYTDVELSEGDTVRCDVFTASGLLITQVTLVVKFAHMLNESVLSANPIVGISIEGNQMSGRNLAMYQNQSLEELAVFVVLHYKDGTKRVVACDNQRGFIYGLDTVLTTVVNPEGYDILVKYYLTANDACGVPDEFVRTTDTTVHANKTYYTYDETNERYVQVIGLITNAPILSTDKYYECVTSVVDDGKIRFLYAMTKLVVMSYNNATISQISPIILYNKSTSKYEMKFLHYLENRAASPVLADNTRTTTVTGFNGSNVSGNQTVTLTTTQQVNGVTKNYTESFKLQLFNHSAAVSAGTYLYWLISRNDGQTTYGGNTDGKVRPIIKYREHVGYYIPVNTGYFCPDESHDEVERMLENFYYDANPPKIKDEAKAPAPTHFMIRSASNGNTLLTEAIALYKYTKTTDAVVNPNKVYYIKQTGYTNRMTNRAEDVFVRVSEPTDSNIGTYYEASQNFGYDETNNTGTLLNLGTGDYTDNTLIVEFYRIDIINNIYEILYGVPVDCIESSNN